ncbi:acetoin utilization protein [Pseudoxanthomonas broegbernensis]|uniref:Acetoin utilization protein n=1 Tax=Pseudoxanthomonas broegbernensis TaxID=83619 RepID=A0A7V8GK58_9GAMM|nr:histone deacetylase family protein [Pseudoxanthomonas broegbernensis]KAF1684799.1 acetoin utilization protein [Pseudoxanthomonas broegbernensis]MBB6066344.1 acetoin utilization deacetylase AcuC-like enzyme [Pseudoxanthomonas broegbernensis]
MLAYTHPACLAHDPGPGHPEQPARLRAVLDALDRAYPDQTWREAPVAQRGDLCRVHDAELVDQVLEPLPSGLRPLDADTVLSPGSAQAALHAAGAGLAAVDAVMAGEDATAFCAVRPPGHHATADTAMGFCLFNNIAVAAAHARDRHGLERIAIVDFDVHHGNGTQAIFQHDPAVAYFSSHQSGLYPNTGSPHERGMGNMHNVLLPPGSGGFRFRNVWLDTLLPALDGFGPQLLLVSAGFDAHMSDPLADLMLDAEDFAWLTTELRALALRHASGRVVSMLEGGYNVGALAECAVAHVGALR